MSVILHESKEMNVQNNLTATFTGQMQLNDKFP